MARPHRRLMAKRPDCYELRLIFDCYLVSWCTQFSYFLCTEMFYVLQERIRRSHSSMYGWNLDMWIQHAHKSQWSPTCMTCVKVWIGRQFNLNLHCLQFEFSQSQSHPMIQSSDSCLTDHGQKVKLFGTGPLTSQHRSVSVRWYWAITGSLSYLVLGNYRPSNGRVRWYWAITLPVLA